MPTLPQLALFPLDLGRGALVQLLRDHRPRRPLERDVLFQVEEADQSFRLDLARDAVLAGIRIRQNSRHSPQDAPAASTATDETNHFPNRRNCSTDVADNIGHPAHRQSAGWPPTMFE